MVYKTVNYSESLIDSRINKGPVAVIECSEEIPCDPCRTCCPNDAISFEESIISIPELDTEKCYGCGICIAKCPGMAIFVLDGSYSDTEGLVSLPYEFLPLPQKDQEVEITGKAGEDLCEGTIYKVKTSASFDCTAVVTLKVPKKYLMEARGFRLYEEGDV